MEQNEFEKRIKDQLENWTMSPSPMVWKQIEQRLHKPDSGNMWWRAIAASLIIAVLGVGLWYWTNNNNKDIQKQNIDTPQTNLIDKQPTKNNSISNNTKANDIAKTNEIANQSLKQNKNTTLLDIKSRKDEQLINTKENIKHNKKQIKSTNTNKSDKYFAANNNINNKKDKTQINTVKNEVSIPTRLEKDIIASNKENITTANIATIKVAPLNVKTDYQPNLPTIANTKQKISWSMYMDNGVSWQSNTVNKYNVVGNIDGTTVYFDNSKQTPPQAAYSYRFGFNVNVPVFNRWSISGGVSYLSLSSNIALGDHVNDIYSINRGTQSATIVDDYYQNGNNKQYTTQNRFIELPVSIGFQALKTKKLPVWIIAGVSMLKQVEANNVLYDASTNILYKDNSAMQPIQWQLHFSANTTLWHNAQSSLKIGPYYQFGLKSMYQETSLQTPKRWQLFGVKLNFDFGGKK